MDAELYCKGFRDLNLMSMHSKHSMHLWEKIGSTFWIAGKYSFHLGWNVSSLPPSLKITFTRSLLTSVAVLSRQSMASLNRLFGKV